MMTSLMGDSVETILESATVLWRETPPDRFASAPQMSSELVDAMNTVLHETDSAFYVSTPITTGPGFVAWRRSIGANLAPSDPAYIAELDLIIEQNIASVRPLVASVQSRLGGPVIDPTRLGPIATWRQKDYHAFWVEVIEKFVGTVVFADGWHYSSGCSLEFAAAIDKGLLTLASSLDKLTPDTGSSLLESAVTDLEAANLDASPQRRALRALAHRTARDDALA